jgi:Icc protein
MCWNCIWIDQPLNTIRILQVSDCHVSADPNADYRGQNADRNLTGLLFAMRAWDPGLVLLTGDVSEDASPASYARVAVRLGTIGAPVLALPGNHDDPKVMKDYFKVGPWGGPRAVELGQWLLVALDSTVSGKISGAFSQQALERFDACMRGSKAQHILVALHHQPVPVNAPWIDRYALQKPERFLNYLDREKRIRCVAWGHVHHEFDTERKGVKFLGAPSCVANSLPASQKFTLDLAGPSCRWLELGEEGSVETGIFRPVQSSTGNTNHKIK